MTVEIDVEPVRVLEQEEPVAYLVTTVRDGFTGTLTIDSDTAYALRNALDEALR